MNRLGQEFSRQWQAKPVKNFVTLYQIMKFFLKKVQWLSNLTGWTMLTKLVIEILLNFGNINIMWEIPGRPSSTCHAEHTWTSLPIRQHPSMSQNTSQKHSFLTFHRKQNQHILGRTSHCGISRTPVLVSTLCTVTERPWTKRHHIFSESYDQQLPDFNFQCIFPKCIFA